MVYASYFKVHGRSWKVLGDRWTKPPDPPPVENCYSVTYLHICLGMDAAAMRYILAQCPRVRGFDPQRR